MKNRRANRRGRKRKKESDKSQPAREANIFRATFRKLIRERDSLISYLTREGAGRSVQRESENRSGVWREC